MYLRGAEPGDEEAVARVHVRSWQQGYRGLLPDDYLDQLDHAARAISYTFADHNPGRPYTTLAVDGEEICGFATSGPCRDPDMVGAGELYAMYVDPAWWGQGVGRRLIEMARRRLTDQHFSEAVLWVLVGNERAEQFYRIDGWALDGRRRLEEIHGVQVDEVRYRRSLA